MMKSKPFSINLASNAHRVSMWRNVLGALGLCILVMLAGCNKQVPVLTRMSETQKKFETRCRESFDLHVSTRMVGATFWIYLPTKEPIFDYESQRENSAEAQKKPSKFTLQYLDGNFKNNGFIFEYDVVTRKKSKTEDYGYNSSYTDSYVKTQNNIFTAISDVFFNTDIDPLDTAPKFFMLVITDIKKGIETRSTLYLEDFKRFMSGDLPYEEYMKRFLSDTKGGQGMIGDETGSHLEYSDILMPDFLTKQIINRINFKFQRSDFEPSQDYDDDMINIIAQTTRYYHFEDFQTVQLHNLRNEKKFLFERNQLKSFGEDAPLKLPTGGKLIHVRFENGETTLSEQ